MQIPKDEIPDMEQIRELALVGLPTKSVERTAAPLGSQTVRII